MSIGTYLPQQGPTFGATMTIAGSTNIPQPTWIRYNPPQQVGRNVKGKPVYQGLPTLTVHWDYMDIDGFQAISVLFFTALNSPDGPIVDFVWPSPYEAGRFLQARAYLEWPAWDQWKEAYLQGVEVVLSSVSLPGQGLFF